TRLTSTVPPLTVLTLTNKVPNAWTPQPNWSSIGSARELPGDMIRPLNDETPGIGIGDELGSGTGTKGANVLDVDINIGTLRTPKLSRNSNPNPLTISCRSARKTSVKPVWNSGSPQDGLDRNTGRTVAGST